MKHFTALFLLLIGQTAFAQTQLATRQQAVDANNAATDQRGDWIDWVQDTEAEIDNLPAGEDKDQIESAWNLFVSGWFLADTAAASMISNSTASIAAGDAESDPMLKGLHYATAVSWATLAENQLDGLGDDYDAFVAAIDGTEWTPSGSPPN